MATFAIDGTRQKMMTTGVVEPVNEWIEVDGKRRPGDVQARQEDTGMPLWGVEVVYQSEDWGRKSTVSEKVTVGAQTEPKPGMFQPVIFEGLAVSVRVDKRTNQVSATWMAEAISGQTDAAKKVAQS